MWVTATVDLTRVNLYRGDNLKLGMFGTSFSSPHLTRERSSSRIPILIPEINKRHLQTRSLPGTKFNRLSDQGITHQARSRSLRGVSRGTGSARHRYFLKAVSIMNSFVNDILENISAEASRLAHYNKRRTITSREIHKAVRLLLPGELARHDVSEGTKAVTKFAIKTLSRPDRPNTGVEIQETLGAPTNPSRFRSVWIRGLDSMRCSDTCLA
ncbi:hypothetical protein RRG08_011455 [Elysia crispata]|uniref:Core Histone H2A/H2B/H3 domain-containing protein n=1 Tax=Elysia crispata TaxID=231223 RepID=A0AAE1DMI6_9GAST|nr:hypothetical protein RRG08_011455 [Elysia crispata]